MTARHFTRSEIADRLARADAILSAPRAHPWIERFPGRGRLVLRFILPLEMAPTANVGVRHRAGWALAKDRASCLAAMAGQMAAQWSPGMAPMGWCANGRGMIPTWPAPLSGRPQLRAVRFCSVCPDDTASWWKQPGDCLLMPRTVMRTKRVGKLKVKVPTHVAGLGVLRADDRASLRTDAWVEPAPRGEGGVLIEVWGGVEECNG